jgi:hypothetical protein
MRNVQFNKHQASALPIVVVVVGSVIVIARDGKNSRTRGLDAGLFESRKRHRRNYHGA